MLFHGNFFTHMVIKRHALQDLSATDCKQSGDSGKRWLILESHSTTVWFTVIGI